VRSAIRQAFCREGVFKRQQGHADMQSCIHSYTGYKAPCHRGVRLGWSWDEAASWHCTVVSSVQRGREMAQVLSGQ
jgi:hypothetical protein